MTPYILHLLFVFRTKKAMGGKLPFGESLRIRLDIIRPTMNQIREFIKTRPSQMSPRIK